MIWIILGVLVVLWAIGFAADLVGGLIHFLLILAAIVLVIKFVRDRTAP